MSASVLKNVAGLVPACAAVAALLASIAAHAQGHWVSEASTDGNRLAALCTGLVKRLNYLPGDCAKDALQTFPEFSRPPWQVVDTKSHSQLIAALFAFGAGPIPFIHANPNPDLARFTNAVNEFISAGGEIRLWRTRLLDYYGPRWMLAPPGDQSVVLMVDKRLADRAPRPDPAACPGELSKGWYLSTFIALPDLSGPDLSLDTSFAIKLAGSYPVIYHGETLLISYPVLGDFTTAHVAPAKVQGGFCSFRLEKGR